MFYDGWVELVYYNPINTHETKHFMPNRRSGHLTLECRCELQRFVPSEYHHAVPCYRLVRINTFSVPHDHIVESSSAAAACRRLNPPRRLLQMCFSTRDELIKIHCNVSLLKWLWRKRSGKIDNSHYSFEEKKIEELHARAIRQKYSRIR